MMVRRCSPRSFWLRVFYVTVESLLPLVNLYILKLLIDSVQQPGFQFTAFGFQLTTLHLLLAMCGVFLLNRIVHALSGINNDILGQRLIDHVSDLLQHQSARLDMQYYDTPAYHDTFHRAQQEATFRPLQVLSNFMALGGSLLSIAGVVAMLVSASWWVIVVMIAAVLPGFGVRLYKARSIYRFRRDNTQLYRRTSYYGALLTGRDFAKELRSLRLAPLFRMRFVDARKHLVGRLLAISRRLGALDIACGLIEAAAMFAVVWLLLQQTLAAAITVGTFVMLFEAFRRGQGYLSSLVGGVAGLYDNRLFVGNLFEFLDLQPSILSPARPVPFPGSAQQVEFRDITFRYPDMQRNVLEHFTLTARRGEITRIDGCNGFGKSTLVKLLLRLYDPNQGQVLVDGTDLRQFALDDLRSHLGVLFQDFVRYNLTARENIVPADTQNPEFEIQNSKFKIQNSNLLDFVDRLPQGLDTQLGRLFDDGSELSMGQWQRLAIARAVASDAPILLFDEPTAWLDHTARQHFQAMLDALAPHKIIILITHS